MAINLYEFFDLTMETSSDYVSRYDIELNTFLREFEDNTEALFIDYQKVYLKKMSQAIIESINKINSNDPEGEFVFNHLQKKLATNRRILEFLDQRLNAPNKAIAPEPKENASKDEVSDFLDKLNNGKVIKSYMIDFLESRNTRQKLEALIEDIENYKVDYITNALVYNETNTKPFLEESFTIFKELVLSKMEDLKSLEIVTNSKSSEKPKKDFTKEAWFKTALLFAEWKKLEKYMRVTETGKLEYRDGYNPPSIAFELGDNSIQKCILGTVSSYTTPLNIHKNIFSETENNLKKLEKVIKYCKDNKIEVCDFFMNKYNKILHQLK